MDFAFSCSHQNHFDFGWTLPFPVDIKKKIQYKYKSPNNEISFILIKISNQLSFHQINIISNLMGQMPFINCAILLLMLMAIYLGEISGNF
jgi:hypothetical protein